MNTFTIKDLENLSGIKAHTIRIWEQRYSFLKPRRTNTNIRYYSNDELKAVLNIALLNKYGFKISHIDKMSCDERREKIVSLSPVEAQHERLVNDLLQYMVEIDIDKFEDTLDKYIKARGIDKAITYLVFPFLEKIGILWLTNHVNAAQEHLVTNIIRQKLIIGIENARSIIASNKVAVSFLPEGEHHELGLLYAQYLLKSRGVQVLYLGANVPLRDLSFIVNYKKPDFMYSHITCMAGNFNFEKFMQQLRQQVPAIPLVLSGQLAQTYNRRPMPGVQFKTSMGEVLEFIASL